MSYVPHGLWISWEFLSFDGMFCVGDSPRQKSTAEHSQLGENGTESFSLWHSHRHFQLLE